jgi:Asp-tRNA(Asn)/Glu-tRNA(Gln) amidotransferase A subunit family amidase
MTGELTTLTACEAVAQVASGRLTAIALVEALLARIAEREATVRAWVHLDRDLALAAARACDAEPARGALHGLPIGVKDVIDTQDQPTQYNSPLYAGHRPAADAACVARLRRAGAIILGKTVTTEFAFVSPGPTRHPHDPSRTPGGSSSGSAAAVADFMVPVALATQTGGSTIRPAAFCGIYGYKPVHGLYETAGLKALSPSLDTIGLMARDTADLALLSSVMAGRAAAPRDDLATPPKLAVCRTPYIGEAEPDAIALLDRTIAAAAKAGAAIRDLLVPPKFAELNEAHRIVMSVETARSFAPEWAERRDGLSRELAEFIARGLGHSAAEYAAALTFARNAQAWLAENVATDELVLTLSAPGEAPPGQAATGSAIFNRLWTLLHAACLTVPLGAGAHGLPLGVQLVAPRDDEARLFATARWLERHGRQG